MSAARYIREHSQTNDVIQDSENDRIVMLQALAERREFAVDPLDAARKPKGLEERLKELSSFKTTTREAELTAFAAKNKIAWYLLRPETSVSWAAAFRERSVFNCGGYRVYQFLVSTS